jgi:hypothetical protein
MSVQTWCQIAIAVGGFLAVTRLVYPKTMPIRLLPKRASDMICTSFRMIEECLRCPKLVQAGFYRKLCWISRSISRMMKRALLIFTVKDFRPVLCVNIAGNRKTRLDHHTPFPVGPLSIVVGVAKEIPALRQVRSCIGVSNLFISGFGQHFL